MPINNPLTAVGRLVKMKTTLASAAYRALMCSTVNKKINQTQELQSNWLAGQLSLENASRALSVPVPGRPGQPELVSPRRLKPRKLHTPEGKAAFIHALAHIEFNALNLALDAVYRFPQMPRTFYTDWLNVAVEEALHFELLAERLNESGYRYGDFPAHNSLWEMAVKTETGVLERMAMVPRVYEARGLDVTPGMIERLRKMGDSRTAGILMLILRDEIGHVAAGNRWYLWACGLVNKNPQETFKHLIREYRPGPVKGPFNYVARLQAGFTMEELKGLEKL